MDSNISPSDKENSTMEPTGSSEKPESRKRPNTDEPETSSLKRAFTPFIFTEKSSAKPDVKAATPTTLTNSVAQQDAEKMSIFDKNQAVYSSKPEEEKVVKKAEERNVLPKPPSPPVHADPVAGSSKIPNLPSAASAVSHSPQISFDVTTDLPVPPPLQKEPQLPRLTKPTDPRLKKQMAVNEPSKVVKKPNPPPGGHSTTGGNLQPLGDPVSGQYEFGKPPINFLLPQASPMSSLGSDSPVSGCGQSPRINAFGTSATSSFSSSAQQIVSSRPSLEKNEFTPTEELEKTLLDGEAFLNKKNCDDIWTKSGRFQVAKEFTAVIGAGKELLRKFLYIRQSFLTEQTTCRRQKIEIESLPKREAALNEKVGEMGKAVDALKKQLATVEKEKEALLEQRRLLHQEKKEKDVLFQRNNEEREKLKNKATAQDKEIALLQSDLRKLKAMAENVREQKKTDDELRILSEKNAEQERVIEKLNKRLEEATRASASTESATEEKLRCEVKKLKNKKNLFKDQVAEKEKELERLKADNKHLKTRIEKRDVKIEKLKTENDQKSSKEETVAPAVDVKRFNAEWNAIVIKQFGICTAFSEVAFKNKTMKQELKQKIESISRTGSMEPPAVGSVELPSSASSFSELKRRCFEGLAGPVNKRASRISDITPPGSVHSLTTSPQVTTPDQRPMVPTPPVVRMSRDSTPQGVFPQQQQNPNVIIQHVQIPRQPSVPRTPSYGQLPSNQQNQGNGLTPPICPPKQLSPLQNAEVLRQQQSGSGVERGFIPMTMEQAAILVRQMPGVVQQQMPIQTVHPNSIFPSPVPAPQVSRQTAVRSKRMDPVTQPHQMNHLQQLQMQQAQQQHQIHLPQLQQQLQQQSRQQLYTPNLPQPSLQMTQHAMPCQNSIESLRQRQPSQTPTPPLPAPKITINIKRGGHLDPAQFMQPAEPVVVSTATVVTELAAPTISIPETFLSPVERVLNTSAEEARKQSDRASTVPPDPASPVREPEPQLKDSQLTVDVSSASVTPASPLSQNLELVLNDRPSPRPEVRAREPEEFDTSSEFKVDVVAAILKALDPEGYSPTAAAAAAWRNKFAACPKPPLLTREATLAFLFNRKRNT